MCDAANNIRLLAAFEFLRKGHSCRPAGGLCCSPTVFVSPKFLLTDILQEFAICFPRAPFFVFVLFLLWTCVIFSRAKSAQIVQRGFESHRSH